MQDWIRERVGTASLTSSRSTQIADRETKDQNYHGYKELKWSVRKDVSRGLVMDHGGIF